MCALDLLHPYLRGPVTVRFPRMALLTRDDAPPLAEGDGEFEIVSERVFRYRMLGRPADLAHSLRSLAKQRDEPYEPLNRFRLVMTDEEGREWMGGWTVPAVNSGWDPWSFTGTCDAFTTDVQGHVSESGLAEARFLIPRDYGASFTFRVSCARRRRPGDGCPSAACRSSGRRSISRSMPTRTS